MNAQPPVPLKISRRHFIRQSAAASLVFSAIPILGAEERAKKYRAALIGCGWWGNNILGEAMASGECKIAALCDVDGRFLNRTADRVKKEAGYESVSAGTLEAAGFSVSELSFALKRQLESDFTGDNRGKPLVPPYQVKVERLSLTPQELGGPEKHFLFVGLLW